MKVTEVVDVGEGWYKVTFKSFLGSTSYVTNLGVFFYDSDGNRPGLLTECRLGDTYKMYVNWKNGKFWNTTDNQSDSYKARIKHLKAAQKAKEFLND